MTTVTGSAGGATLTRLAAALLLGFFLRSAAADAPGDTGECPMLESSEVAYLFPAARDTLQTRFRSRPFPSCTFTWQAIREARQVIGGQTIAVPGNGRLTITRAATRSPQQDWQKVLASYGSEALQDVPAIGRRAVWSHKRSQLSVLATGHIYHVAVDDTDNPDLILERAGQTALLLVDRFD